MKLTIAAILLSVSVPAFAWTNLNTFNNGFGMRTTTGTIGNQSFNANTFSSGFGGSTITGTIGNQSFNCNTYSTGFGMTSTSCY